MEISLATGYSHEQPIKRLQVTTHCAVVLRVAKCLQTHPLNTHTHRAKDDPPRCGSKCISDNSNTSRASATADVASLRVLPPLPQVNRSRFCNQVKMAAPAKGGTYERRKFEAGPWQISSCKGHILTSSCEAGLEVGCPAEGERCALCRLG